MTDLPASLSRAHTKFKYYCNTLLVEWHFLWQRDMDNWELKIEIKIQFLISSTTSTPTCYQQGCVVLFNVVVVFGDAVLVVSSNVCFRKGDGFKFQVWPTWQNRTWIVTIVSDYSYFRVYRWFCYHEMNASSYLKTLASYRNPYLPNCRLLQCFGLTAK